MCIHIYKYKYIYELSRVMNNRRGFPTFLQDFLAILLNVPERENPNNARAIAVAVNNAW